MTYLGPSFEDAIFDNQDSDAEWCHDCQYKGNSCRNQCMQVHAIHNPNLQLKGDVKHA